MSADLFAEFEPFSKPTQRQSQQSQSSDKPGAGQPLQPTSSPTPFSPNQIPFGAGAPLSQPNISQNNQWFSYQQPSSAVGWTASSNFNVSHTSQPKVDEDDDDDAWGDFEVASPEPQPIAPAFPQLNTFGTKPNILPTGQNPALQRTRITRASTLDLLSNNLVDAPDSFTLGEESKKPSWPAAPRHHVPDRPPQAGLTKPRAATAGAELLFDADDFDAGKADDDDDFGDFETVQETPTFQSQTRPSQPTATIQKASDLLSGLNLTEPASPYPQAPKSPSFYDRNPFPGLAVTTPPQTTGKASREKTKESPITAWPSFANKSPVDNVLDEDWGSIEGLPARKREQAPKPIGGQVVNPAVRSFAKPIVKPAKKPAESDWDWDPVEPPKTKQKKPAASHKSTPSNSIESSSWDWDPVDTKPEASTEVEATKDALPPTNVPPPSILLSIFPELFDTANQKLYQPVSGQSFSVKKRILSDPKTVDFLRGYLALATVLARIVAGRKLRWHRDKFLSQKMSISAAGSKGMKLATVDKAQTAREDREAADVVSTWNEQVGRLRSAVAAANTSLQDNTAAGGHLKIPEIKDTMQVQTAKAVPTAPKACLICGLKRDERLAKVDVDVEDSFGEWWVDHWGHTACRRFWLQHEAVLRQR